MNLSSNSLGLDLESSSVQVEKTDTSNVNLEPAIQAVFYESLFDELTKLRRFKQVFREGNRNAGHVTDLLILKTTIQNYKPRKETRPAVTTMGGATMLTIRTQLCKRDGHVVLERTINGNVRAMGSNLHATRNIAHNIVNSIKQSLPELLPQI